MKLQHPIMTRIKTKLLESGSPFTPVMNTKLHTGKASFNAQKLQRVEKMLAKDRVLTKWTTKYSHL